MSREDQPRRPPPDPLHPHPPLRDIRHGSPYVSNHEQEHGNDRNAPRNREYCYETGDGSLDYDGGEANSRHRRGRSSSPREPHRRDQSRDYRNRSRDDRDRDRIRDYRNRDHSWDRSRSRGLQRDNGRYSHQYDRYAERIPRSPSPPPNDGYTITDHYKRRSIYCGPQYGTRYREYRGDLTEVLHTGDVVSIPYCDFANDAVADFGEGFALSSQGKIYVKKDIPLVCHRVERSYVIGWLGRSAGKRGLKGTQWIPESDHPKYLGIATIGDPEGPAGNDSPHDQLGVEQGNGSRRLSPSTHIFAGGMVKVRIPEKIEHWGRLRIVDYYRLESLMGFLTAMPLSPNASLDSIPTGIGLDIDSLRRLRTPKDSLPEGWEEQLAALAARHKPPSATDDAKSGTGQPQAQIRRQTQTQTQTQAPAKDDLSSTAAPPLPKNSNSSSPPSTMNRAMSQIRQPSAAPNNTDHHAPQLSTAETETARNEPENLSQVNIRQAHIVIASGKDATANVMNTTCNHCGHNAPVQNEQHNMSEN